MSLKPSISNLVPSRRAGLTLMEVSVALAVTAVLGVIVAQALIWSVRERARLATRQAAVELAANVLEAARGEPIEKLDQTWGDAQTIPSAMADLLPGARLKVQVESATVGAPLVHGTRVTAAVEWNFEPNLPAHRVSLTTILTPRTGRKSR